ncbi:glycosyltransferase [Bombilactobacillus bombi]|uniref:glycosyltransferase n=1 Tax=Bombilactobacillus bombi TaxID=1303590 RepID=UPI0015E6105E|nr:glycosyltransferase [Bombilactobacillus bombi]
MKILQVNAGNESGGGRTILINLLQALLNKKIDTQLLVFEKGPVSDWAQKAHIPTTIMNQEGRFDLRIVGRLRKFINDNNIDVVNTHGPRANFIMSLIHNDIAAKWVATVHSDPNIDFADNLKGNILTKLNIQSLKKAERLILITPRFEPVLTKLGITAEKMVPIFNAMDFAPQVPQTLRHEPFSLANVARLTPVKNQELLLKTLAQVDFNFRLQIVGDGNLKIKLQKLVRDLQLESQVDFVGFQDDTAPYYQQADLFVLTSNSEGFPLVLLEAANQGIPAVTTDVGSCGQIVQDDTGWVIPPKSVVQLKLALEAAYQKWQQDQLRPLGQKFYQYCSQHFSSENLAEALLDIYQDL